MDMGPKYCDLHKLDMHSALIHRRVKRGRKSGQQDCVHSLLRGNAEKIFKDLKKSVLVKLHLIVIRQTVAVDPVGIDQPLHRKLRPKDLHRHRLPGKNLPGQAAQIETVTGYVPGFTLRPRSFTENQRACQQSTAAFRRSFSPLLRYSSYRFRPGLFSAFD